MVIIIIYKSSSSTNPTPTPTPSVNIQQLNGSIRAFDEPYQITSKPSNIDGYFPITVNPNFRFNSVIVSENNKTYVLAKYIQEVGPTVPIPYPYYQVEAKDQPAANDIVLFQTTIKPEISTVNAVQFGLDGTATTIVDLADFLVINEGDNEVVTNIAQGECLVSFAVSDNTTVVSYIYNPTTSTLSEGFEEHITAPAADSGVIKYYKQLQVDESFTEIPVGIRLIDKNNNNKLIYSIQSDDPDDSDGFGILKSIVSPSVVTFDFSGMDVEPNTKKEFKTTK